MVKVKWVNIYKCFLKISINKKMKNPLSIELKEKKKTKRRRNYFFREKEEKNKRIMEERKKKETDG